MKHMMFIMALKVTDNVSVRVWTRLEVAKAILKQRHIMVLIIGPSLLFQFDK